MEFEWDREKSLRNLDKHGIDFEKAKGLWNDVERVEIKTPYPLEDRYVLIGKLDNQLWSAIYTIRGGAIRLISVRRSRKREVRLYEQEKTGEK